MMLEIDTAREVSMSGKGKKKQQFCKILFYVIAKYFNCLSLYQRTLWNISDITFPYIFVIISGVFSQSERILYLYKILVDFCEHENI